MPFLSDDEQRAIWKSGPIQGSFQTHEGLGRKVNPDGSYAPFHGSRVVFRPEKQCFRVVQLMRSVLARKLEGTGMPAQPLPEASVHMTLLDLVSPELCPSCPEEEYDREAARSINRAAGLIEEIRKEYAGRRITMAADRIVSTASGSLVLTLRPQTDRDGELLTELVRRFGGIQSLPDPLPPHIPLAYLRPGRQDGDILEKAVVASQIGQGDAPAFVFLPEGLTAQSFLDMQDSLDIPERICFCCDGGLNRSVMAAQIVNSLARERNLPVVGEARAAWPNTQGWPVRDQVRNTLESHGIRPDGTIASARYLHEEEVPLFSSFAGITDGAMERFSRLYLPKERVAGASGFFFGVRDPEYGEISYEQAFGDLYARAERYLDSFDAARRKHLYRDGRSG